MTFLIELARRASQLPILFASLALFTLMVMTFCDVVMRSLFNTPIEAATELTRILMALVVFAVLPVISCRNEHIAVDLLDPFVPYKWHALRDGLIALATGIMLVWPAIRVMTLAERARSYGDVTEYLSIPQFYIGWAIAIATMVTSVLLIIRGLILLIKPALLER